MKQNRPIIILAQIVALGAAQETFYHNHTYYGNWSDGPELIQARTNSSAGIVIDEETEEKLLVVTGGVGNGLIYDQTDMNYTLCF